MEEKEEEGEEVEVEMMRGFCEDYALARSQKKLVLRHPESTVRGDG